MFEQTNQTELTEMTADMEAAFESGLTGEEKAENQPPAPPREETYTVKYNGKTVDLGLEELKTRAQMGMNYEHVKAENDRIKGSTLYKSVEQFAKREGISMEAAMARMTDNGGNIRFDEVNAPYLAFAEKFPDVTSKDIDAQVWEKFHETGDLIGAYMEAENARLRARLAALEQNERNDRAHIGSAANDRANPPTDAFLEGLLGG